MPQHQVQATILFLKMSCTKLGKWLLLYHSSFLCVLHFDVVFLLCCSSPLIFDAFPSVLVCNPDLFFINRFRALSQKKVRTRTNTSVSSRCY